MKRGERSVGRVASQAYIVTSQCRQRIETSDSGARPAGLDTLMLDRFMERVLPQPATRPTLTNPTFEGYRNASSLRIDDLSRVDDRLAPDVVGTLFHRVFVKKVY